MLNRNVGTGHFGLDVRSAGWPRPAHSTSRPACRLPALPGSLPTPAGQLLALPGWLLTPPGQPAGVLANPGRHKHSSGRLAEIPKHPATVWEPHGPPESPHWPRVAQLPPAMRQHAPDWGCRDRETFFGRVRRSSASFWAILACHVSEPDGRSFGTVGSRPNPA